jgi:hypothetical protein
MDLNIISHANSNVDEKWRARKGGNREVLRFGPNMAKVKIPLGISFFFPRIIVVCCPSIFFLLKLVQKTLNKIIQGAKIQNGFNF